MQLGENLGQFLDGEIGGAGAGVVPLEAEVDRIRAVFDGRDEGGPVPGRGEELGSIGGRGVGGRAASPLRNSLPTAYSDR